MSYRYQGISSDLSPPPFYPARSAGIFFEFSHIVDWIWKKARFIPSLKRLPPSFVFEILAEGRDKSDDIPGERNVLFWGKSLHDLFFQKKKKEKVWDIYKLIFFSFFLENG